MSKERIRHRDRIDELLDITYENNKMLKNLTYYMHHIISNSERENNEDFLRNVLANLVSNFPTRK